MFNKAERARREAARNYHDRRYRVIASIVGDDYGKACALTDAARFHRKQAELWAKSVKAFDDAALRTVLSW